jgi:hypothetical protein
MTENTQESTSPSYEASAWLHDEYVDKVNAAVAQGDHALAAELSDEFANDDADGLASARFADTVERLIQLVR